MLREKAEKEYQSYIQEIKELDRILEQDRRLKEFMATKTSNRMEKNSGNAITAKKGLPYCFNLKGKPTNWEILERQVRSSSLFL